MNRKGGFRISMCSCSLYGISLTRQHGLTPVLDLEPNLFGLAWWAGQRLEWVHVNFVRLTCLATTTTTSCFKYSLVLVRPFGSETPHLDQPKPTV